MKKKMYGVLFILIISSFSALSMNKKIELQKEVKQNKKSCCLQSFCKTMLKYVCVECVILGNCFCNCELVDESIDDKQEMSVNNYKKQEKK
ncbi:hypothetical protein KAH94_04790 [bacterium]|nr:hypothetical protein [bacterium]